MPDPFYERMTVEYKLRKWLEAIWPSVYNVINGFVTILFKALMSMIKATIDSFKAFGGF